MGSKISSELSSAEWTVRPMESETMSNCQITIASIWSFQRAVDSKMRRIYQMAKTYFMLTVNSSACVDKNPELKGSLFLNLEQVRT